MKRGDRVILFQDGKLCRGVIGVVVSNVHGHHVKVEYVYYGDVILKGAIATLRVDKHRWGGKKARGYTEVGYCTAEKLCNVRKWYRMVTAMRYGRLGEEDSFGDYRQSIIDDVYKLIEE